MNNDGSCNINIVENVVNDLKKYINPLKNHIIIRSTIPVGTCTNLNVNMMPESITEKNWKDDFINCKEWIIGVNNADTISKQQNFKEKITNLINISYKENKINYNKITFIKTKEAEMIKLFRNSFLAVKVSFCNEIYKYCTKNQIDYNII